MVRGEDKYESDLEDDRKDALVKEI